MSIAHLIGYPIPNPMPNPNRGANRGRIARVVSCRVVSAPFISWSPEHHCVAYVTREAASPKPVQPSDDMMTLRARSIA